MDPSILLDIGEAALAVAIGLVAFVLIRRARRSEARYRTLAEHLPKTSTVVFDRDLRVSTAAGPLISRLEGASEGIQGSPMADVLPAEEYLRLEGHYRSALEGESRSLEYRSPTDGRDYWVQVVPVVEGGSIVGGMAVTLDVSERKRAERDRDRLVMRLERLVRTDELTELPNRRAYHEELVRELARSRRADEPVCVAMLDLDRFKEYNDENGHPAGDAFLRSCSAAWADVLRTSDLLARIGGEEFALILPNCQLGDAVATVERLRAATPRGGPSCSAGVVEWNRRESPEGLVARADAALYEAKHNGRDQVRADLKTPA